MTYRLHFERDVPDDNAPSVSELERGTPWPATRGFVVVTDERRLTVAEWIRVRILRRPDPRTQAYPVEAVDPAAPPGPDTQTFTVEFLTDGSPAEWADDGLPTMAEYDDMDAQDYQEMRDAGQLDD